MPEKAEYGVDGGVDWFGISFWPMDIQAAVTHLERVVAADRARHVHLCNAWTIALASENASLMAALKDDRAVNLVDGVPLARELSALTDGVVRTTRGPSLFEELVPILASSGASQLLMGSTPDGLRSISDSFRERGVPESALALFAPPFREVDDVMIEACAAAIVSSGAKIVWLGLGTPKQDILAERLSRDLGVTAICVGAAFDFVAGTVKAAPKWLQGSGFEWAYRFTREPGRLWRRYTWGNARFIAIARRERAVQRARRV